MTILISILIAYLLGSIPTGLWIGKYIYHKNLRAFGSGNIGMTNAFRVLGAKAGITTLVIDMLKGTVAVLLPVWLGVTTISPLLIGFFAILGHTFPIFAQFKGGKAVATSAGVMLGFSPWYLIFLFFVFVTTLFLTSMISMASVIAALVGMISVLLFPAFHFLIPQYDWLFSIIVLGIASIIIVRHKDNIQRIKAKTENIVPFGLNVTKQKPKTSD